MKNKFILVSFPAILFIVAAFYVTTLFIKPSPKKELSIATGSKNGQYYQTALIYKKLLEEEKVKVTIINTTGSIQNLELLQKGKVDIAFIQNGTVTNTENIEALASIYYEPLWVFYNKKHKINYLSELVNKKISIGAKKSGTQDLSLEILKINNINKENSELFNYTSKQAKNLLIKDEIDTIFDVTSPNSNLVQELLENKNISLFSINRAKAYSRKFNYLESINLYEGTINIYKNIPNSDKQLLATTAILVTNPNSPHELIRLLLKKVKKVHSKKTLLSKQNQFPNLANIDIPINEEAQRYLNYGDSFLEKIFPYWIASNLDRLKILLIPLLTLLLPIFKGVFPLYRWSIRSKIYRWYNEVQKIDLSLEESKPINLLDKLNELEKLKKEIKDETKVPLSYMGEYYDLIMHIELIISKLKNSKKNK